MTITETMTTDDEMVPQHADALRITGKAILRDIWLISDAP